MSQIGKSSQGKANGKNSGSKKGQKVKNNQPAVSSPAKKSKLSEDRNSKLKQLQIQRMQLPIYLHKNELMEVIEDSKSLVIVGETGCGKTTQIPQYIDEDNLTRPGKIAITQPRRVAAISVATRVAQEYGLDMTVGGHVGYSVRFEDVTSPKTKIKFLTDGMLLREALKDRLLCDYRVVILDEAHERTIHTDVLFGIVKEAQLIREVKKLPRLKIIVMSATMDVDHFANYFNCQVVYLEGRTYPLNIRYTTHAQEDYQTACIYTFFRIHQVTPPEDAVLIFLTGQEEVEHCAHQIRLLAKEVDGPPVKVCPLYASQTGLQQMNVFNGTPTGTRKVVISTNIAETSITIPGIKFVIDSGMVKVRTFCPSTGLEVLKVQRVSQEQAIQRAGRAGRDSEGFVLRLYTNEQFKRMRPSSIPEIQRANLNSVALQMFALGVRMSDFDFMDSPPKNAINAAFVQLKLLGAIDSVSESITLTELGKKMVKFPLDPRFSKILIMADQFGCLKEAITVVALMSSDSILLNPPSKKEQVQEAREKFRSPYGDHLTLLNIYRAYENLKKDTEKNWCQEHFLNTRNLLYVKEVRTQLTEICKSNGQKRSSCGGHLDQLRKCLLAGLFMNFAEIHGDTTLRREKQYLTLDKGQAALIHPSSVLYGIQPAYLLFTEVVRTSKCYLRNLTIVEGEWLNEVAPEYAASRNFKFNN
ncbi:ATP-dependent RNA helicase DHX33 [Dendroctonus ponderosae]|uniref:ATP-dependent RNA helicase DHX33 n=1 Tax=Dendroctonus ponderosae TaxID=77166 RepID=UPI002036218D|nr:ATP-dependent RNA helicase DHX33 [Dendroctonus ponderosae]